MSSAKPRAPRPARPARAPAPSLPPFEALDKTHHEVLLMMERLDQLMAQLEEHGMTGETRALADTICTFFDNTARSHHAAEEEFVFPKLLRSADATLVQHVLRLQQDHGWLEEDWLELQPQLEAIARGYNWYDPDFLRTAIPVFAELYREHIALEESTVYPASRDANA